MPPLGQFEQRLTDTALNLKNAGLVAASGAEAIQLDLGAAEVRGDFVLEVSAIELGTGDEVYFQVLQGSNDNFGTFVSLMAMNPTAVGRWVQPFSNRVNDVTYTKVRILNVVQGTIATGINYSARLTELKGTRGP